MIEMGNKVKSRQNKKILPFIQSSDKLEAAALHYWIETDLEEIKVGSGAWFTWLGQEQSFRLTYVKEGLSVGINILPERSKDGRRIYWRGFKSIGGQLQKKYVGASSKLIKSKLDEVGLHFWQLQQAHYNADPTSRLHEALSDYESLITQLLPHLPRNMARHSRREMNRIQDNIGN